MHRSVGYSCRGKQNGFSLVELMVTIGILAIVLAIAVPSLKSFVLGSRIATQVNDLVGAINLARSEAVKRGGGVRICKSSDGVSCASAGTDWAIGWLVFNDDNFNGTVDAGETVIRAYPALTGSTAVATAGMSGSILFTGLGHPPATFVGGRTLICPSAAADASYCRTVCVNSQGRPRVDTPTQLATDALCGN